MDIRSQKSFLGNEKRFDKHKYVVQTALQNSLVLCNTNSDVRLRKLDIEQRGNEKLQSTQMWFLGEMLKVKGTDRETNKMCLKEQLAREN